MVLPKVATPTYELVIPSSGKKIKYRPFLVKEEKILILAGETEDQDQIKNAVKDVLKNCILTRGVKVENLAVFDIEYLFLNVRGKSVGENISVLITCPDEDCPDHEKAKVEVDICIDDIQIKRDPNHSRDIKLNDDLTLRLKYPSMGYFIDQNFSGKNISAERIYDLSYDCIESVFDGQETFLFSDCTRKEIIDWVGENLTRPQFEAIFEFLSTMPKLYHEVEVTNPKTNVKSKIALEGLDCFFS